MATQAAYKRLNREYALISANPPPYITAHPSETNVLEWHYILTGPPNTPYDGGQYWGTLTFPTDYPFKPPAIRMHTPSGRFRCSERLCLSISDFHPKSFNPAWSVSTILLGVMSFMTSEEMTTGSVSNTDAQRRAFASQTKWWNSTGGGSSTRTISGQSTTGSNSKGNGAIKSGDGGKKFHEQWPEVDEENWKWMEQNNIDPRTGVAVVSSPQNCAPEAAALGRLVASGSAEGLGAVVDGGRGVGAAGQGFLRRNMWYIAMGGLFVYVLLARMLSEPR